MATIQMDLPAANRFVSSLSKSLQALCHGCMDFDTEIEIVGYINVNIDCGSKVDYVLNEKVSKSTNNSMQFISNSFLAKKDQPKTERSCSPIPELNVRPSVRGPASSSYASSQLYKSSNIFSPHSQVLRGPQKRSWSGGDWRSTHRKMARGPRSQYDSSYTNPSQTQHSDYSSQHSPAFHKPSTSQQDYTESPQTQIQVKSEAVDETAQDNNSVLVSDVNIKSDPDSAETSNPASSASFLHPQSAGDASYSAESNSKEDSSKNVTEGESFFKTEQDDSTSAVTDGDQGSSVYNNEQSNDDTGQGYSESDVTFDTTEGQEEYIGEESGDGSQFDIIEIDDEDEDLAAFSDLGKSRENQKWHQSSSMSEMSCTYGADKFQMATQADYPHFECTIDPSRPFCTLCNIRICPTKKDHQKHINFYHRDANPLPWVCSQCQMGFFSKIGLNEHVLKHQGALFECRVCGIKFTIKKVLKKHMQIKHKVNECPSCKEIYSVDSRNPHICRWQ